MINIEVKNVKIAKFASEETLCYQATIYVDGHRFAIGRNDGRGGPDMYDPIAPATWYELQGNITELNRRIRNERADEFETHTRPDGSTYEIGPTLEWLVNDALIDWQVAQDLKRDLRKKVLVREGDAIREFYGKNWKLPALIDAVRAKLPEAVFLNEMPFDEALTVYRDFLKAQGAL